MKIPIVKTKDILSVTDLTMDEIITIFELSIKLKKQLYQRKRRHYLKGKTLAMIFEKSSTRTRVSFETALFQLGGHALFLSKDDIQLGRGETISDTARVLSRYVDGIMIRTFSHNTVLELAEYADVPVINGLSDSFHPCQSLTDFFTIYERVKNIRNVKLTFIGDSNNVANSLLLCAAILGIDISIASPEGYWPDSEICKLANELSSNSGSNIEITSNIDVAIKNADFIYTDVWISMGHEKDAAQRKKDLADFKLDQNLLAKCSRDCMVMHCLPAHRDEEIENEVIDSERSIIFDQAENRLHVQKAILCSLMQKK